MDNSKFNQFYVDDGATQIAKSNILYYEQLPQYDLFISQVVDFLNEHFPDENYTTNIIQNYIKNEVISAPLKGKRRGYTKQHLIQLALLNYMRPILTTEEIKNVFALAFNEINDHEDDMLSWETVYRFFSHIQKDSLDNPFSSHILDEEKLTRILIDENLKGKEAEKVYVFLTVMTLIAKATVTKKLVQKIVKENFYKGEK